MKKIKYFIALIFFLEMSLVIAQSPINDDVAHKRYWYYRTRLINDFMKVGKNQGESIVFAQRNYNVSTSSEVWVGPDQIDLTNMYMAVLALEYKLLKRTNQDVSETIKELYHLLYTLNRLDLEAEFLWNNPVSGVGNMLPTGELNGYMLREDFPMDFIASHNTHYNYSLLENGYAGGNTDNFTANQKNSFTGLPFVDQLVNSKLKEYLEHPADSMKKKCTLVQDKYHSMLAAFMFIVKYIPSDTYYYENGVAQLFQDNNNDTKGIKEQAIAITNRLKNYLKGNTFDNSPSNDWLLKQPDGSDIGFFKGAGASPYSFTASRAICHINNGFPWQWTDNCMGFQDLTSEGAGLTSYYTLSGPQVNPALFLSEDISVFLAWGQVCSNYPVVDIIDGNPIPVPCSIQMAINSTLHNLEWSELARKVLFEGGTMVSTDNKFYSPISDAPCNGPYRYAGGIFPTDNWSSPDRTEHPSSIWGNGSEPFYANYPGIDYMLLHNLYYVYLEQEDKDGQYEHPFNLMDYSDEMSWPVSAGQYTWGILGNRANVKVFQNLKSIATINAAAANGTASEVEYRAGKQIELLPGFSVESGSNFSAYVKRYLCSESDYGEGLRNTSSASNDYETDEMNTQIPIHYVEHPKSNSDLYSGVQNEEPVPTAHNTPVVQNLIKPVRSQEKMKDYVCSVSPNPNAGVFKISVMPPNDEETFKISIISMAGLEVYQTNVKRNVDQTVDLSNHSKGIYMVSVFSDRGFNKSFKVNVQ